MTEVVSVDGLRWLPYERDLIEELYREDALLVMAKGLGILHPLVHMIQLYSSKHNLVLCLDANEYAEQIHELLRSRDVATEDLPPVVDAKSTSQERKQLYRKGGCFLITSRVLVVDLLTNNIDAEMITGILVHNAHRVSETSVEAFIVRLYREKNRQGFLKAFTDEAISLSSGFNKLEHVLKHLYLRQVCLYPRFHVSIHEVLEAKQPDVYEIDVALSGNMQTVQEAALVALDMTLKELQRTTKALDATELTMDKALSKSFAKLVRSQLDPLWHKLPFKAKQLVGDLSTIRQILTVLPKYDAISFYSLLLSHQTMSGLQRSPSPWLFTEAADRLMHAAKSRLYQIVDKKTKKAVNVRRSKLQAQDVELEFTLEGNPKWKTMAQVITEIQQSGHPDTEILVMTKDERTSAQLREYLVLGEEETMKRRFGHYLMQRESAMKKKGSVPASSLGIEQQLLLHAAAKLRSQELTLAPGASTTVEKSKAKDSRKRGREEIDLTSDVASFGLSVDELQGLKPSNESIGITKSLTVGTRITTSTLEESHASNVTICTYGQSEAYKFGASAFLQDQAPTHVLLYDPDMAFVRELEVYHARRGKDAMEVYFIVYEESAEQQAYLTHVAREKKAFETLIYQKQHMVLPANVYDAPYHVKEQEQREQLSLAGVYSMDTRTGGQPKKAQIRTKVVVDMREFRSALPSMLHRAGLHVRPMTLEIGDYILSPQVCIERKSIGDLFSSFQSGRLFNQAEAMRRHYDLPVLLIEFSPGRAFSLQDSSELREEISANNIVSKLTLLVLHFPSLRLLWSRSPYATVDLFRVIKKKQDEPEEETAAAIGTSNQTQKEESSYNTSSVDVLRKLPGINDHNYRTVMDKVDNLAALSKMSQSELSKLIGKTNGRKLFAFFNSGI